MSFALDLLTGSLLRSRILLVEMLHKKICLTLPFVLYRSY